MTAQQNSLYQAVRPTTVIEPKRLSSRLAVDLTIASETFQLTGSFKFRAAYNLAARVSQQRFVAASSGNFGQALAYACSLLGKSCTIVMPDTSARVKIEAVREFGALVELIDVKSKSRDERVRELSQDDDVYATNAYDDPLIIDGNASLGQEIAALNKQFDFVVVPIGGGGLSSGVISGIRRSGKQLKIVGAEPKIANRTAQSLKAGHIISLTEEPQTIADGARILSLGKHNWELIKDGLAGVVEVAEDTIEKAVRLLYNYANLKVEPTGALSVGAVLSDAERFRGKSVCCIVTGGNVDAETYARILIPNS